MGIFNFTNITFNKNLTVRKRGQNLVGSQYDSDTLKYPIDLGSYDKGHYMVFHINEQLKTSYQGKASSDSPTIFQNRQRLNQSIGGTGTSAIESFFKGIGNTNEYGKEKIGIDVLGYINDSKGLTKVEDPSGHKPKLDVRTIRRTTDTIALYMPDTLNFAHQQGYSDISLGGGMFAVAGAALSAVQASNNKKELIDNVLKNASPFVLYGLAKKFGGDIGMAGFAGLFGAVANPQLEVIYSSPALREFQFEFMFYPRSTKEATEVQGILDRFRFHQAPELLGEQVGGIGGFFMVPPSEFDIKFYYNGRENTNIPKISTCVLTSLNIDYAPNGFAAYEIPGTNDAPIKGATGMPVAIRLTLGFKETEMLTKANFASDAGRASKADIARAESESP